MVKLVNVKFFLTIWMFFEILKMYSNIRICFPLLVRGAGANRNKNVVGALRGIEVARRSGGRG